MDKEEEHEEMLVTNCWMSFFVLFKVKPRKREANLLLKCNKVCFIYRNRFIFSCGLWKLMLPVIETLV
jgi:hypothetical protein